MLRYRRTILVQIRRASMFCQKSMCSQYLFFLSWHSSKKSEFWPLFVKELLLLLLRETEQKQAECKVIIEKSRGGRFFWNRNWDLGWIWADWEYWKKKDLGRLFKNIVSVYTKKFHKMKSKKIWFIKVHVSWEGHKILRNLQP